MRITKESDYALRIITYLAAADTVCEAQKIAAETSVSQRFALKILHKLTGEGIVRSYKGSHGGYRLQVPAEEITLKTVIELIDGPIALSHCLGSDEECSMQKDKTACIYHYIFDNISMDVSRKLQAITIADVLSKNFIK